MQTGFNSDITYRGVSYHVQTEDWGLENPFIVSRVFQQGAVLKTFKTSYATFLGQHKISTPQGQIHGQINGQINGQIHGQTQNQIQSQLYNQVQRQISAALKSQHQQVVDFVMSGQIFL